MSTNQAKALALIPKVSGPLSIFGSCWILYEIIKDRSKKFHKPYHRLLFSMCIMDLLSSTCLALSTWPIPEETSDRWGASGNEATCKAQAFFIQANISSPIFNFMLSLFFLLKIQYRYTDNQLSKAIEPAMQTFTLVFGLGTSAYCLGMDLFADSSLWCWINATPKGCQQTFQLEEGETTTCVTGDNAGIYRWAFFFAPLWASAFGAMIIMAMLYRFVRKTEKGTESYDFELAYAKKQMKEESCQRKHESTGGVESGNGDPNDNSGSLGPVRDSTGSFGDILADGDDDIAGNTLDEQLRQLQAHQTSQDDMLDDISICSSILSTGTNRSTGSVGSNYSSGALSVKYVSRSFTNRVNEAWTRRKQLKRLRSQKRRECRKSKIVARQAYRYVGVFYITWIAGTINRLLQLLNGKSFYWIMVLHAIFTPLQGFFNFLVYQYPKWEKKQLIERQKRRQAKKQKLKEKQEHSALMQQLPFDDNDNDNDNNNDRLPVDDTTSNTNERSERTGMFAAMMKESVVMAFFRESTVVATVGGGREDAMKKSFRASFTKKTTTTTTDNSTSLRKSSNVLSSSFRHPPPANLTSSLVVGLDPPPPLVVEERSPLNDSNQLIGGQIIFSTEFGLNDPNAPPHDDDDEKVVGVVADDEDLSSDDEDSISPQSPETQIMDDANDGSYFEVGHA